MTIRRALHAQGYRFLVNVKKLPGSPDIVFTAKRKAIFVHGCFWHRHRDCRRATTPKSNAVFWQEKFAANVRRDARNVRDLMDLGWRVQILWECEVDDPRQFHVLKQFLGSPRHDDNKHG